VYVYIGIVRALSSYRVIVCSALKLLHFEVAKGRSAKQGDTQKQGRLAGSFVDAHGIGSVSLD